MPNEQTTQPEFIEPADTASDFIEPADTFVEPADDPVAAPQANASLTTGEPSGLNTAPSDAATGPGDINFATGMPANIPLDPRYDPATAALAGAAQGIFAAKDFLTGGEVAPEDRSDFRKAIDAQVANEPLGLQFVSGVSQFAVGMLGVGKLAGLTKLPEAAAAAGKAAKFAYDTGKAAVVGATFFDPHAGNIANLVQAVPALQNPVTGYLAAEKDDGDLLARAKNAMASIGMDLAVAGTFAAGLRVFKAVRSGDTAAVDAAKADLAKAVEEQKNAKLSPQATNGNRGFSTDAESLAPEQRTAFETIQSRIADLDDEAAGATADRLAAIRTERSALEEQLAGVLSTVPEHPPQKPFANAAGGTTEPPAQAPANDAGRVTKEDLQARGKGSDKSQGGDTGTPEDIRVVQSPTAGADAIAGEEGLPPRPKPITQLSDEQVNSLIDHAAKDGDAILEHGSWDNAVDAGHVFGDAGSNPIPWQKIASEGGTQPGSGLDALIARTAETLKSEYDAVKGPGSDASNARLVGQRAALWNEDPEALMGLLQAAGKDATQLRANMDAAFLVGQRAMQDAYAAAARINAGYFEDFGGSREAAVAAFKQIMEVASTAYGTANAMKANAGRALRGMREEFRVSSQDLDALRNAPPETMVRVLTETQGNPRAIITALQPKLWQPGGAAHAARQFGEAAQFLLINNLVSGPLTHAVILATNTWQVASRPMERIIGSLFVGGAEGSIVRSQALRQYTYLASSLYDSFQQAVKAFSAGDAIMSPRAVETSGSAIGLGQTIAQAPFKSMDSVPNILHNAVTAAVKTIALPTRMVGFQDELVKQVVYRAKVQAEAHVQGAAAGLTGDALTRHVRSALFDAFDSAGRATHPAILDEAKVATFQQDLVPTGSLGLRTAGSVVSDAVNAFAPAKVILPFVKTPVNVFRGGVKLTPGLNLVQKEYRDAIRGVMGPEQQAQAVGQMATGSLLMGTLALLAYEGRVTGGGPSDPRLRAELMNTGWQPYSFALPGADGTVTYVKFSRYDPIAMPMGLMADIMDVAMHPDPVLSSKAQNMGVALFSGMVKALTDKLYLQNLAHTIDMVTDPDRKGWKTAAGYVANYVPLASALRSGNQDPYMRDAATFIDKVKSGIPGFSTDVPPRRDFAGEPVTAHRGLWVTDTGSEVDFEMRRMAAEQNIAIGAPSPHAHGGVDLRTITMSDGRNAYDRFQELAAQPSPDAPRLKHALGDLIRSDAYRRAPDGAVDDRGTRASLIASIIVPYRDAAMRIISADPIVSKAMYERQMNTAAAYAAGSPNPTPANREAETLGNIGRAFGVDLGAFGKTGQ